MLDMVLICWLIGGAAAASMLYIGWPKSQKMVEWDLLPLVMAASWGMVFFLIAVAIDERQDSPQNDV